MRMTTTLEPTSGGGAEAKGPKPIIVGKRQWWNQMGVFIFILVPFAALIAAVPLTWGWGLTWLDVGLAFAFFYITGHGVTIGYHRYFTHGSFKANRPLKITLAIAGSMALQGPPIIWVADHRRHHAYSDREGDPHSPWLFGTSPWAMAKGFWHAHMGWVFDRELTNKQRFAPDLLADKDIVRVNDLFALTTAATLLLPAAIGGLVTWSWWGALTAFFWASLVRIAVLHHVTWCINSVCHVFGNEPFTTRDHSKNVWWLSVAS